MTYDELMQTIVTVLLMAPLVIVAIGVAAALILMAMNGGDF